MTVCGGRGIDSSCEMIRKAGVLRDPRFGMPDLLMYRSRYFRLDVQANSGARWFYEHQPKSGRGDGEGRALRLERGSGTFAGCELPRAGWSRKRLRLTRSILKGRK